MGRVGACQQLGEMKTPSIPATKAGETLIHLCHVPSQTLNNPRYFDILNKQSCFVNSLMQFAELVLSSLTYFSPQVAHVSSSVFFFFFFCLLLYRDDGLAYY